MNEKMNFHDLVGLLSEKAGITKKDAENFLREFFDLTTNALLEDKQVKIKNLGTFKIVDVNDRESVDVRTGERVVIPSHSKVSFAPDAELSKVINEPFAMFEPVEIEDETDITPNTNSVITPDTTPDVSDIISEPIPDVVPDPVSDAVSNIVSDPISDPIPDSIPEETSIQDNQPIEDVKPTNNPEPESVSTPDTTLIEPTVPVRNENEPPENRKEKNENGENIKNKKSKKKLINWLLATTAVLVIAAVIFILNNNKESDQNNHYTSETETNTEPSNNDFLEQDSDPEVANDSINENIVEVIPETTPDTISNVPETVTPEIKPESTVKKEAKATQYTVVNGVKKRKIAEGERLTLIALQEYGSKDFWVYIYEENKSVIKNPENVMVGIEIIIPPASKYSIDKNNPESIKKAIEIQKRLK